MDIATAPPSPGTSLSPTSEFMVLTQSESIPSIDYMFQPLLRIAGMRILPMCNSRGVTSFNTTQAVRNIKNGRGTEDPSLAHKINEFILLIPREADNNSGTFPVPSQRLYHAPKDRDATARLVMLPNENHGYSPRESILLVLAEIIECFKTHLKNKKEDNKHYGEGKSGYKQNRSALAYY